MGLHRHLPWHGVIGAAAAAVQHWAVVQQCTGSAGGSSIGIMAVVLHQVRGRRSEIGRRSKNSSWQRSLMGAGCWCLQGLDVSLAGVIPYAALRLGCYDALKWSYKKVRKGKHYSPLRCQHLASCLPCCMASTAMKAGWQVAQLLGAYKLKWCCAL